MSRWNPWYSGYSGIRVFEYPNTRIPEYPEYLEFQGSGIRVLEYPNTPNTPIPNGETHRSTEKINTQHKPHTLTLSHKGKYPKGERA